MSTATFGMNVVDWEARVDRPDYAGTARPAPRTPRRLRRFSVADVRLPQHRYMTAAHIGTWAMDKLIRFALLPRGGEPGAVGLRLGRPATTS